MLRLFLFAFFKISATKYDTKFKKWLYFGRSDRTRTCSILLPKQARYQLRYTSKY